MFRVSLSSPMALFTTSSLHKKKPPYIFASRSASSLPVCSCCFLFFLCFLISFSAASESSVPITRADTTTATTPAPPPGFINTQTQTNRHHHRHPSLKLILIVSCVSGLVVIVISMSIFSIFCLRMKNKRRSKRVENASEEESQLSQQPKKNSDPKLPAKLTWNEIETLTKNFSEIVGQGGFSTVYLAQFPDSTLAALKIINRNSSERLNRMFKQELEILLNLGRHENIVNLVGYSDEENNDGVLCFEYIPNGNLHSKLKQLSWSSRMKIAFQLGQAIEYLHDRCSLQIVHGDIKASNVLLDEKFNCKLCDFGFAKMGFSSSVQIRPSSSSIMGSPGYMDPHYLRTGIASKKNDVYSFGVVILELITGIEAFCSEKEQQLTTLVGPMMKDPNKVADMVDHVMGDFNVEEGTVMACISAQCLKQQPSLRPSMSDILKTMKEKISSLGNSGFGVGDDIKVQEMNPHFICQ